jgi:hypothetical protein
MILFDDNRYGSGLRIIGFFLLPGGIVQKADGGFAWAQRLECPDFLTHAAFQVIGGFLVPAARQLQVAGIERIGQSPPVTGSYLRFQFDLESFAAFDFKWVAAGGGIVGASGDEHTYSEAITHVHGDGVFWMKEMLFSI